MTDLGTMITKKRRTRSVFLLLRDRRSFGVFVFRPWTVVAAMLLASSLAAQAPEQERAQAEALSKRAAERLAALQKESEALVKQEQTLLVELRKLEVER